MNQKSLSLRGVCTPICTIFTENGAQIDKTAQLKHLDTLLEAGVDLVCVGGGTGEFSFLTEQERCTLTELIARHINGKTKLMVHTSAVMTEQTIKFSQHAESVGADCLLVLPPYFEGPVMRGVYEHYEKVACSVNIDIMAYNIPVHTGIDLDVDVCTDLMQIDNINYLKDSTGDFLRLQQLLKKGIRVFNGADPLMFYGLMAGAQGCFWGASNAIPFEAVKLVSWMRNGQWNQAMDLWRNIYPINDFIWHNPFNPSVKAAGNLLGHDLRQCRKPAQPLTAEELAQLELAIAELKNA